MSYITLDDMNCYYEMLEKKKDSGEYYVKKSAKAIHYCSTDSFLVFIKDYLTGETIMREGKEYKYLTFFASHLRYLNDRNEYIKAFQKLKKELLDEKDSLNEDIFVACFSQGDDNLTQWKYYGKDTGLAIEFEIDNVMLNYCNKDKAIYDMKFCPRSVVYHDQIDILNCLKASRLEGISRNPADVGQAFIPFWKDSSFKDELECRIALYNIMTSSGKQISKTQYRSSGGLIKPFIEMKMFLMTPEGQSKLPIKNICVGPGQNQVYVFNAVYRMLEPDPKLVEEFYLDVNEKTTSNGIKIVKSQVPFVGLA